MKFIKLFGYILVQLAGLTAGVGVMHVTAVVENTDFWELVIGAVSLVTGHICFGQTEKWYRKQKEKNRPVFKEGFWPEDAAMVTMMAALELIGIDVFSVMGLLIVLK
jgi:hypothetical protein